MPTTSKAVAPAVFEAFGLPIENALGLTITIGAGDIVKVAVEYAPDARQVELVARLLGSAPATLDVADADHP